MHISSNTPKNYPPSQTVGKEINSNSKASGSLENSLHSQKSNDLQSLLLEASTMVPIAKKSIPSDLTTSNCSLEKKKDPDSGLNPFMKSKSSFHQEISLNHFQNKLGAEKIIEGVKILDKIKYDIANVVLVKTSETLEIKFVKGLSPTEIKAFKEAGYSESFYQDGELILHPDSNLSEGTDFVVEGKKVSHRKMTHEESEEFNIFVSDYHKSQVQLIVQPQREKNLREVNKDVMNKQKEMALLGKVNSKISPDTYKNQYTPAVTDIGEVLRNFQFSRKMGDKEHEAYIEYANHADVLKKIILKKELAEVNVNENNVRYTQHQKTEINTSINDQSLKLDQRNIKHISALMIQDFNKVNDL